VVHELESSKLRLDPDDERLGMEVLAPIDWYQLSKGELRVSRSSLPDQTWIGDDRRIFCGPLHFVEKKRRGIVERLWLPVFLVHVKGHAHQNDIDFALDGDVQINLEWLDHHFGVADEDQRDDLLIRLGMIKKGPTGETELVRERNLEQCWSCLEQLGQQFDWIERRSLRTPVRIGNLQASLKVGMHPRLLYFKERLSSYSKGLIKDLRDISKATDADISRSALSTFVAGIEPDAASKAATKSEPVLVQESPLNPSQRAVVSRAWREPLTVAQGPPGTGKSTVVRSVLLTLGLNGQTALFSSTNHKAVDAVVKPINTQGDGKNVVADLRELTGRKSWVHLLLDNLDSVTDTQVRALEQLCSRLSEFDQDNNGDLQEIENIFQLREELAAIHQKRRELRLGGAESWRDLAESLELPYPPEKVEDLLASRKLFLLHPKRLFTIPARRKIRRTIQSASKPQAIGNCAFEAVVRWFLLFYEEKGVESSLAGMDDLNALGGRLHERFNDQTQAVRGSYDILPGGMAARVRSQGQLIVDVRAESQARGGAARRRLAEIVHDHFPELLEGLPLWAMTSKSINRSVPAVAGAFDLAVIDEAAQCDPAAVIPLLYRAKRALFIGDPMQLAPFKTIAAHKEEHLRIKHGLSGREFSRFSHGKRSAYEFAHDALTLQEGQRLLLREHYRCHPDIAALFNSWFYGGGLLVRTAESSFLGGKGGLRWTEVPGGSESINNSRWHRPQVDAIVDALWSLADRRFDGTVGVVTPFAEHAKRIRDAAHERVGPNQLQKWSFLSATADKFQGDEKDVVLFGLVGGGEGPPHQTTSRFYNEARRFNVAISRARLLLHVFGDRQWASTCGVEILQALEAACHAPKPDMSHVRTELIGPVWEPLLADEMRKHGLEFSPQYEACGFYLDFALFPGGNRRINIEVDGETYHRDENGNLREEDVRRDHILKASGWTVQRFWVYQLREDLAGCLNKIKILLDTS